jgi:hypothetical protein
MHNKSKNWTDIQWIISSFSIAITLGLWGTFASHEKSGASVSGQVVVPTQTDQIVTSTTTLLLPGQKLLFGGSAPLVQSQTQTQPQIQPQPPQVIVTARKHGGGGGGGGGGSPHAGSGSSHP